MITRSARRPISGPRMPVAKYSPRSVVCHWAAAAGRHAGGSRAIAVSRTNSRTCRPKCSARLVVCEVAITACWMLREPPGREEQRCVGRFRRTGWHQDHELVDVSSRDPVEFGEDQQTMVPGGNLSVPLQHHHCPADQALDIRTDLLGWFCESCEEPGIDW